MTVFRLVAALTSLAFCVLLGCDGTADPESSSFTRGRAEDEWTRSVPMAAGAALELINRNGAISAEATEGTSLELVATRVASARDDEAAGELLQKLEMRETKSDHGVRVEVVLPGGRASGGVEVTWSVRVPAGVSVDLRTENGQISLAGLSGGVRAKSVNGGVRGRALAASAINAETVNGGVEIELAEPLTGSGNVALESVNGAVELRLPGDSKASLSASVVNGSVRAEGFELAHTGERSRTRLRATLGGGGTPVKLETTNGSARIRNAAAATSQPAQEPAAPSSVPEKPRGDGANAVNV